jgi:Cys-rich repeat protein
MTHSHVWIFRAAIWSASLSFAAAAYGAWAGGRATPTVREIVAVDSTGEANWPYGAEDIAGDGLGAFLQPEQSIDIRTAYAATDQQRLWARVYVSGGQAVGGNVHAFVFIDSDRNAATGGTGVAPEINANFTGDPTPGGYEHVVEVLGNGTGLQLWNWQGNMYVQGQLPASRATGEGGTDTDPIRIGASTHGYTQVAIELGVVSLTQACDANLYFRTTNDSAALGAGDLDVGQLGSCVPGLDGNGVPGVLVPPNGCRSNAECPAGAVCQNGQCAFASACTTNADCAQGMQCTADGRCVPAPNGTCTSNAQCNGLICQGGQCAACPLGGNQCGAGYTCGADGRCSAGSGTGPTGEAPLVLAPGEEIKGGACNCALSVRSTPAGVSEFCLAVVAFFVTRRRAARDG